MQGKNTTAAEPMPQHLWLPIQSKKDHVQEFILSLLTYCSSVFYARLQLKTYRARVDSVQRLGNVIICRGYKDISKESAGLLAAEPIHPENNRALCGMAPAHWEKCITLGASHRSWRKHWRWLPAWRDSHQHAGSASTMENRRALEMGRGVANTLQMWKQFFVSFFSIVLTWF